MQNITFLKQCFIYDSVAKWCMLFLVYYSCRCHIFLHYISLFCQKLYSSEKTLNWTQLNITKNRKVFKKIYLQLQFKVYIGETECADRLCTRHRCSSRASCMDSDADKRWLSSAAWECIRIPQQFVNPVSIPITASIQVTRTHAQTATVIYHLTRSCLYHFRAAAFFILRDCFSNVMLHIFIAKLELYRPKCVKMCLFENKLETCRPVSTYCAAVRF